MQLNEALCRIKEYEGLKRIIVCTNSNLADPGNYESVGFRLDDRKTNETESPALRLKTGTVYGTVPVFRLHIYFSIRSVSRFYTKISRMASLRISGIARPESLSRKTLSLSLPAVMSS